MALDVPIRELAELESRALCAGDTKLVCDALIQEIAQSDFLLLDIRSICNSLNEFRLLCERLARGLGNPMVQNEQGDICIEVYDRQIGRIEEGVRYHQTRQGGDIHIDSVNRPDPMKYLLLCCASPALLGGQSILVRSQDVLGELKKVDGVIETLKQPFFFEGRGMSDEIELFELPILAQRAGRAEFRYLRPYIESAHQRAGSPLNSDQVFAFDVLDAVLELSELQYRFALSQGQILFTDDVRVFHGRTGFVDGPVEGSWSKGRHMLRFWIE